ncbi:hypothetical protein [Kitasatospora herbaricolor]|uniref:hypothetical protein n=1 Tax=Kitasatospora herbaricolor TaxID=68217 RepID=UPI0036DBC999
MSSPTGRRLWPRRRSARWLLGSVAAVVVAAVAVWNLPLAGQWREDRPARTLVIDDPGDGRDWRVLGDGEPRSPSIRGLDQRWGRTWQQGLHSNEGYADQLSVRVDRLESPTWAWLVFRGGGDPAERDSKLYDVAELDPGALAPHADERRFSCARSGVVDGACTRWWVWLRYGQYLVELEAVPVGDPATAAPAWVGTAVAGLDRSLSATGG